MQKVETESQLTTELMQPKEGINPEAVVSTVEQDRQDAIDQLKANALAILSVVNPDLLGVEEIELSDGAYLVVGLSTNGISNNLYFYVASRANYQGSWSDHAKTCAHLVEYQLVGDPLADDVEFHISRWGIDPGGDNATKTVKPYRVRKEYDIQTAALGHLSDIGTELNEIIAYIKNSAA
ncbi:MAG: hypothetical protein QG639_255 [Patescibacteria group bacterium]|jgi:hypothetical protein|nr:hypothetical protein [Patescibacteria group bacterium]